MPADRAEQVRAVALVGVQLEVAPPVGLQQRALVVAGRRALLQLVRAEDVAVVDGQPAGRRARDPGPSSSGSRRGSTRSAWSCGTSAPCCSRRDGPRTSPGVVEVDLVVAPAGEVAQVAAHRRRAAAEVEVVARPHQAVVADAGADRRCRRRARRSRTCRGSGTAGGRSRGRTCRCSGRRPCRPRLVSR